MNNYILPIITWIILSGLPSARAGGPADDAIALVKQAADFVKAEGKDKAFAEFSDPKGRFVKADLYIFAVAYDGLTMAHGGNSKLVGKDMKDLKDADGNLFIQAMIDKAKNGGGWVDYKWTNPATKKIQNKSTYVQAIEGTSAFLGCGIYK